VSHRFVGLLLFLPVPAVLALFTRQPLGPWPSLGLGVLLMLTHRLYARPFALAHREVRCLWCGRGAGTGPSLELREPPGTTSWRACSAAHEALALRTLGWAAAHRRFLVVGILGSLALFLALAAAAALGMSASVGMSDAVAAFRLGVALSVLPLGWLGPSRGPVATPERPLPFPVHVQALVGTLWVAWLFRLVGLWWLAAAALHLVHRLP
jgi:hypothetical protein